MKPAALLASVFFSLTASVAIADDKAVARNMARKDYEAAMAKIRADDSTATEKCRAGTGSAVEACLIQASGKRLRAEQEAKTKLDRAGQIPSLPKAQAKTASKDAMKSADRDKRRTGDDIDMETKAAEAECKKLTGAALKACNTDVAKRRDEARDMADAMFEKSRSRAKALKVP